MYKKCKIVFILLVIGCFAAGSVQADQLKIAITQDQQGMKNYYKPLVSYLRTKGIHVSFVPAENYPAAAMMFVQAKVDAMFSGSGIAGAMILKKVAKPVVRPLASDGTSTYWAVILAPKGSGKFPGTVDYFKDKKVAFCALASAGEVYFHSLGGDSKTASIVKTPSHGTAILALANGKADTAIVKNRVWMSMKDQYPDIEIVGADTGENPNGTLLLSKVADPDLAQKTTAVLLGLMEDPSSEAREVKSKMDILGYIKTTEADFEHTLNLLSQAGVTASFDFKF
jgi:ABC-type phosphate/phosphonate transport system substrate-binding protein